MFSRDFNLMIHLSEVYITVVNVFIVEFVLDKNIWVDHVHIYIYIYRCVVKDNVLIFTSID